VHLDMKQTATAMTVSCSWTSFITSFIISVTRYLR